MTPAQLAQIAATLMAGEPELKIEVALIAAYDIYLKAQKFLEQKAVQKHYDHKGS